MFYLPSNTSLIESLDQDVLRTFKAHYTQCYMRRIINAIEENPIRENILKVWEDYTPQDAIVVIEKIMNTTKPPTINTNWKKLSEDVVHNFTGFMTEAIKEIKKEVVE